mmetsp:Transcript_58270/g.167187  ORF Transcript_58270/g.167187 Transcript_58270/m.167187 type:complete len:247 (+) Transcript_58270:295-1035(+)
MGLLEHNVLGHYALLLVLQLPDSKLNLDGRHHPVVFEGVFGGSGHCGELCRQCKDSFRKRALEVGNAHDAAVVHALGIRQLETHPLSCGEAHIADVAHNALLATPLDLLPERKRAVDRPLLGRKCGMPLIFSSPNCHNPRQRRFSRKWRFNCCAVKQHIVRQELCWGEESLGSRTIEVGNAHDTAIVHALALRQLKAHPLSSSELHVANVAHDALLTNPLDLLSCRNETIGRLFFRRKRGMPLLCG